VLVTRRRGEGCGDPGTILPGTVVTADALWRGMKHRRPTPLLVLACFALGIAGCDEELTCENLEAVAGEVEVGVGEDTFVSIEDGKVIQVERGSQGGMHVWVSLSAAGIHPGSEELWDGLANGDLPDVEFQLLDPDGGILTPDNQRPSVLVRTDDGRYELLNNLVVFRHFAELPDDWAELDYGEVEAAMQEVDHTLLVRIEDSCGTVVQDEVLVRLDFPPRPDNGDDLDE